jgi:hypothetical protein
MKSFYRMLGLLTATLALSAGGLSAQSRTHAPAILSDRPGIGNGAYAMTPGEAQFEVGLAFNDLGTGDQLHLGQGLFRIGVPGVELRFLANSLVFETSAEGETGWQDVGAGAKVPLLETSSTRLSGLATIVLPIGGRAFSADQVVVDGGLLLDASLTDAFGVSGNAGYARGLDDGGDLFTVTVTSGLAIPGDAGVGVFAGLAGFFSQGSDQVFLEGGATLLLGTETQLDLNAGLALEGDGSFIGLGLAHRVSR